MSSTQFLMVNPYYDMSASFTDASTNIDYQANASRNFINLIGDISNVDVSNSLYEGKTYDPSLSLIQFVKKTKRNFLDSNTNTMLDKLLYWARNTSGQNKFPILKTDASDDAPQVLPEGTWMTNADKPSYFVTTYHNGPNHVIYTNQNVIHGDYNNGAWEYINLGRVTGHCNADGFSSVIVDVGPDNTWMMDGFRYNDKDWVAHEKVTSFRVEYSDDGIYWTQVFQSSSPDNHLVGNTVECTWSGVIARYWRFVAEAHNCATIRFISWKGSEVS